MMQILADTIRQLRVEGEKLRPKGGSLFGGYNGTEQSRYLAWRKQAVYAIAQLGIQGAEIVKEIQADRHGTYFYETSAARVLECLQAAQEIAQERETAALASPVEQQANKVFVVHGRNLTIRQSMYDFLRSLGLTPEDWSKALEKISGAPYIGQVLDRAFLDVQVIVVLFTGDDEARLRSELVNERDPDYEKNLTPQPRLNVLFEAGMAFASKPEQTILVQVGKTRPYSDIAGRYVIHMDNSSDKRAKLMQRLRAAGCDFGPDGLDWLTAGDFESES